MQKGCLRGSRAFIYLNSRIMAHLHACVADESVLTNGTLKGRRKTHLSEKYGVLLLLIHVAQRAKEDVRPWRASVAFRISMQIQIIDDDDDVQVGSIASDGQRHPRAGRGGPKEGRITLITVHPVNYRDDRCGNVLMVNPMSNEEIMQQDI